MRYEGRIEEGRFTQIEYQQFTQSRGMQIGTAIAGILSWPFVLPLVLFARLSDIIFLFCSQLLAIIPYVVGTIVRYEFYRLAVTRCGKNVMIGFGTVFIYRDIEIGDNVLIGMYNTIHHCNFGSYVMTAEGCRFLGGARYHHYEKTDVPMALQGGSLTRIVVGSDVWVGVNAVVMASIGDGSIVGAGAVVTENVENGQIVGGIPARSIGARTGHQMSAESRNLSP